MSNTLALIQQELGAQYTSSPDQRRTTDFATQKDADSYDAAVVWWPDKEVLEDLPDHMQVPSVYLLCTNFQQMDHPHGNTFAARLSHYSTIVTKWLTDNGYDVAAPNTVESAADRKARKNREAQARFRTSAKPAADPALQQRIDVEVEALGELTRNRDAALEELNAQVNAAQVEFLRLCALRKSEAKRWGGLVYAQRDLVAKTKRGQ